MMSEKIEFGDFQTPIAFAMSAVQLIKKLAGPVSQVIEPTCGLGHFIEAAYQFGDIPIEGFEVNTNYYNYSKNKFIHKKQINIYHQD
ncbi:MAG: SAM-dependent methyltransferase, partial [Spirochaetota bacterium]